MVRKEFLYNKLEVGRSGKTHILALIANFLSSQGKKVAVVAPCGELVDNIVDENKNIENPYNFKIMTLSQFINGKELSTLVKDGVRLHLFLVIIFIL